MHPSAPGHSRILVNLDRRGFPGSPRTPRRPRRANAELGACEPYGQKQPVGGRMRTLPRPLTPYPMRGCYSRLVIMASVTSGGCATSYLTVGNGLWLMGRAPNGQMCHQVSHRVPFLGRSWARLHKTPVTLTGILTVTVHLTCGCCSRTLT